MHPPLEAKPLSPAVQQRLNLAKEMYNLIYELHPDGTYIANLRNTIFHAFADLVIEHFGSIIKLIELRQFFGSAFALLRPLIEGHLRAVWINSIASDDEVNAIGSEAAEFPRFAACRAAVEALFERAGVAGLYVMEKEAIKTLHGLTHGGLEQIRNRISASLEVTPYEYPDEDIMTLLDHAGRFAVMMAIIEVQAVEGGETVTAPKAERLQTRFVELRNSYGLTT